MTEKRFVDYFDKDHNYIIQDLQNKDEYQVGFVNCDEDVFLELVNNLVKENEELKKDCSNLIDDNTEYVAEINQMHKENEQLKNHIQELQNHLKRLENENIQTYTLIKEAYHNERTQLGKSVLKQLIEAIQ